MNVKLLNSYDVQLIPSGEVIIKLEDALANKPNSDDQHIEVNVVLKGICLGIHVFIDFNIVPFEALIRLFKAVILTLFIFPSDAGINVLA